MPKRPSNSTVVATLDRISDWTMKVSSPEGQGTATRKKQTGKASAREDGRWKMEDGPVTSDHGPRTQWMVSSVRPMTSRVQRRLVRRQVGLASWRKRVGA